MKLEERKDNISEERARIKACTIRSKPTSRVSHKRKRMGQFLHLSDLLAKVAMCGRIASTSRAAGDDSASKDDPQRLRLTQIVSPSSRSPGTMVMQRK